MPDPAVGSFARIAVVPEVTWGVNPGAGFVYKRFTSDSLNQDTKTTQSKEIRPDRNNQDTIRTDLSASGDLNFEKSVTSFDELIAGAMMSDWSTSVALAGQSIDISGASGNTATLTDAATAAAFANVVKGQWIKLSGFTAAADNGYCRVTTKTSSNVVVVEGLVFVNEAGQTDIAIKASMIRIGLVKKSFTIERQAFDIGNVFDLFLGMRVNTWSLKITPGSILTGKFGFLGKRQDPQTTTAAGTPTTVGTDPVANAIDNVKMVREGSFGIDSSLILTEISFELNNNLRAQPAIAVLGAAGVALGTAVAKGTLHAYMLDRAFLQKYTDFTPSMLAFRLEDAALKGYIFTWPHIKFTKGSDEVKGQNNDTLVAADWEASVDADGVAMQVDRFE